ncbi:MAG: ATP-binding protein, partial [Deltaproteobacteria bacterium]
AMIRVIEETVPVQKIWLDSAEGKDVLRSGFSGEAPKEVLDILKIMYRNLVVRKGIEPELAKAQLLRTEPFQNFADLVKSLPDITTDE